MRLATAAAYLERTTERVRERLTSGGALDGLMLALGGATGLVTGVLAAALIGLIRLVQGLAWGTDPATWQVLVVPAAGGLLVGLLVTRWAPEAGGSGVVRTMQTIAVNGGRFRARVPLAGVVASGTALGTGASGGREGPIVLIGGSVGSLLGRWFAVDDDRMRALVAAGAAAGIGASFNAPIGGMLFAIELIVGRLRTQSLQVIVVASVAASVTARELVGTGLIFRPRIDYSLGEPVELVLYALLGLLAVAVGYSFLRLEDAFGVWFTRLRRRVWAPLTLAIGGLGVGVVALVLPSVLGTGDHLPPAAGLREPIQAMLDLGATVDSELGEGWPVVGLLLALVVGKLVATAFSVGSGSAVGTFAPALFTGAALGGAFGMAADLTLPGIDTVPGAFALVGMAAVFTAVARAPLTAVLIAFELTGDYDLVLPLMLAAGVAVFVGDRVMPDSVYHHQLRQRGIVYAQPDDVDVMQTVQVREVMSTSHPSVTTDESLTDLQRRFSRSRSHGFAVVDAQRRLVGVVSLGDLARAREQLDRASFERRVVGDICTRNPLAVRPDDPVFRAVQRMAAIDVGRIPVVEPGSRRLVGLVRRTDVVSAYQRALHRSIGSQQRREERQLRDLADVHFVELVVDGEAPVAGQAVRDVHWPKRTVLTSVRRGGEVLVPTGDTVLEPNDEVVVLTGSDATEEVRALVAGPDETTPAAT